MNAVWAVFLCKGRGLPYDLQAACREEEAALTIAAVQRAALDAWTDRCEWRELSTGRHWVARLDIQHGGGVATREYVQRVSRVELDRLRDERDSDPAELHEEMFNVLRTLAEEFAAHPDAYRSKRHGDSATSVKLDQ